MVSLDNIPNPNSCLLKIQGQKYRALIDSGAECSMIHRRVYNSLKNPPKLKPVNCLLQSVRGDLIETDGVLDLEFQMGSERLTHSFIVSPELNRSALLGRDFLFSHSVRAYFDLGCIKVKDSYIPLENDAHISSLVRLRTEAVLKPQTGIVCEGVIKSSHKALKNNSKLSFTGEVCALDEGLIANEPGLKLIGSVITVNKSKRLPVAIINTTNKTYRLRRGCIVGKMETIQDQCLVEEVKQEQSTSEKKKVETVINEDGVPEEYVNRLKDLIEKNSDLFASSDLDLGKTDTVKMTIDTGDHPPIKLKPYRTPLKKRPVVNDTVDSLLKAGLIEPSHAAWSFPIVLVPKKTGETRMCVDFRRLNDITKKYVWPLPHIDDIFASLASSKWFTSLDLRSGYHQVALATESDKDKTTFTCHRGLFRYRAMPFGLSNAPSLFQELMSVVLEGLQDFAIAYLDDIIIFSPDLDSHLAHIEQVFKRLADNNLKMKASKCSFLQSQLNYLGHIVSKDGIMPDPAKVKVVRSIQELHNVTQVRGYLGLCSYYRRFISNFSKIAEPLINLTRKNVEFDFNQACKDSLEQLKEALTHAPVLAYPCPDLPYNLYTDASDSTVGAVLTQKFEEGERPIHYISHRLSKSQRKGWSVIQKELFGIRYSLEKLDHYVSGAEINLYTDHKPLTHIFKSEIKNKTLQKWALDISNYNIKINYIAGKKNQMADFLSRLPSSVQDLSEEEDEEEPENIQIEIEETSKESEETSMDEEAITADVNIIDTTNINHKEAMNNDNLPESDGEDMVPPSADMIREQSLDPEICDLKEKLKDEKMSKSMAKKYIILEDVLYYISNPDDNPVLRVCVPEQWKAAVLEELHDNYGGHLGIDKTYEAIKKSYYWPGLYHDVLTYCDKCIICKTRNLKPVKPPVQKNDIPNGPWQKVALDILGPLPTSISNNRFIVSFVCCYSGYIEAFATPDHSADTVLHLLQEEVVSRYGTMTCILTDNAKEFRSQKFKEVMDELNIKHITTSFYNPAANGAVEARNKPLTNIIAKKVQENPQTWDLYLNQALAAIRFAVNESTKFSPYYLNFGRDPCLPLSKVLTPRRKYLGDEPHKMCLQEQHKAFKAVQRNLKKSRARQKKYADQKAEEEQLDVGDAVYLKNNAKKSKLSARWLPHYRIIEKTTPVSFKIRNQVDGKVIKAHARNLRLANLAEWPEPEQQGRPIRRAALAAEDSSSEPNSSSSEEDPPMDLTRFYRRERQDSESSEDIPLLELQRRLRAQDDTHDLSDFKQEPDSSEDETASVKDEPADMSNDTEYEDDKMSIDLISKNKKPHVKDLLKAIINVL